ncbi:replication initiation protein [Planomonospora sp. ID91781]|uniref:replication initiator n=1 Tax=Planomonospora sp. ID91781 TaxID=2738135 RepID=UPI0018C370A3|nr:replication initiator [Planomonospora sp. ID91781]MBG0824608.1 replication initiation protein [Planomonospora sp. ID91781]
MTSSTDRTTPRALRMAQPLARDVVDQIASEYGVCLRPIPMYRTDAVTGQSTLFDLPCGATLESKCAPCAKRNQRLRMAQCREGWHLEDEPVITADPPTDEQRWLIGFRAEWQAKKDAAEAAGEDTSEHDEVIRALDAEIRVSGMRGSVLGRTSTARKRSTRRRQDAPDLPRRKKVNTTLGRTYTGRDGRRFRPSMFITLTLPSYGKIQTNRGVPVDPDSYDYVRAARDALHFAKLVDRFVQNLRRVAGFDVQYFASVEPQKRLAPHLHMAMRGTLSRAEIKQIAAATYHQVWWPSVDVVRFEGEHLPVWVERAEREDGTPYPDKQAGDYIDPVTGEVLPTWDEALDAIGDEDEPLHVVRFGEQVKADGIMAGTPDADKAIGYISKYLTKSIGETCEADNQAQRDHASRLADALRYEPCSPTCANWLRYGVQPKNARAGMAPGRCRGKAHKPEHLGYAGRRVLVSRKWSNKTLTDHRADRRAWVLEMLGLSATEDNDPGRYTWRPVPPGDPGLPPLGERLLLAVAEQQRRRRALDEARARAEQQDLSATEERRAA